MPAALPPLRLSHHAEQRGMERMRLNAASLLRMAKRAMVMGMPMAETRGHLLRWLQEHAAKHGMGNQTCIRDGIVYVIENNTLITVLFLPDEHQRQVSKWLAKNPSPAKPSGSLRHPPMGVVTPESALEAPKRVLNALKSPVLGGSQPGGLV